MSMRAPTTDGDAVDLPRRRLLAVVLWSGRPGADSPVAALADGGAAIEDLDLLADNDALALAREGDLEFYEWASAADDDGAEPVGT